MLQSDPITFLPDDTLGDLAPWLDALRRQDRAALQALIDAHPHPLPAMRDDGGDASSPLHQAIMTGWLDGFHALLPVSNPHLVDASGDTPLLLALDVMASAQRKIRQEVLRAMVSALAPLGAVNRPNAQGALPLALAMGNDDLQLLDLLIEHGANPTLASQGQSLLVVAWNPDRAPTISEWLIPRVNPRACDDNGNTLLHELLRQHERHGMTESLFTERWMALFVRGADPHHRNVMDYSALDILAHHNGTIDPLDAVRHAMQQWESALLDRAMREAVEPDLARPTSDGPDAAPRFRARL